MAAVDQEREWENQGLELTINMHGGMSISQY